METSMWLMLLIVFLAGAVGGVVNALMTDNGFLMPKSEQASGGATGTAQGNDPVFDGALVLLSGTWRRAVGSFMN